MDNKIYELGLKNNDIQYKTGLSNYVYYKYQYQINYNTLLVHWLNFKKDILINIKKVLINHNKPIVENHNKMMADYIKVFTYFKAYLNDKELRTKKYIKQDIETWIYDKNNNPVDVEFSTEYEFNQDDWDENLLQLKEYKTFIDENINIIENYKRYRNFDNSINDIREQIKDIYKLKNNLPLKEFCPEKDYILFKHNIKTTDKIKLLVRSFNYHIYRKTNYGFDIFKAKKKMKYYDNELSKIHRKSISYYAYINPNMDILRLLNIINIYNPVGVIKGNFGL